MSESPVFHFNNDDPELQKAYARARASFRYFWREVNWEYRRIVPALEMACVKAPFSDGVPGDGSPVEQMWFGQDDINFNGFMVSGTLLNAPNELTTVKQGDTVSIPLNHLSDWMYGMDGEVFGGFTVHAMRNRMDDDERAQHDQAWGMEFGDPLKPRVLPIKEGWFSKNDPAVQEHPMSISMAPKLKEQLAAQPELMTSVDDRGWTILHTESLAGSTPTVKVLLEAGADPNVKTNDGLTPLKLAKVLGWDNVLAVLARAGGK